MPQSAFKVKGKARFGDRWAVPEEGIALVPSPEGQRTQFLGSPLAKLLTTQSPGPVPVANMNLKP